MPFISCFRTGTPSLSVCCGNWSPDGRYYSRLFRASGGEDIEHLALVERVGLHQAAPNPVRITTGPMAAICQSLARTASACSSTGF